MKEKFLRQAGREHSSRWRTFALMIEGVQKPYSYCRNPMALGAIVAYLGVVTLIGSISALVLVLIGAVVLLSYIKLLEEKEMELRFGEAYQAYRKQTPFIIPRFWQRK